MNINCIINLKNDPLSQIQLMHMLYRRRYRTVRIVFEQTEVLRAAVSVDSDDRNLLIRRMEMLPCVEGVFVTEDEKEKLPAAVNFTLI